MKFFQNSTNYEPMQKYQCCPVKSVAEDTCMAVVPKALATGCGVGTGGFAVTTAVLNQLGMPLAQALMFGLSAFSSGCCLATAVTCCICGCNTCQCNKNTDYQKNETIGLLPSSSPGMFR